MQLNSQAPKLARKISMLDVNWAEQITRDGLEEIFFLMQRMVDDHAKIDELQEDFLEAFEKSCKGKKTKDWDEKKPLRVLHRLMFSKSNQGEQE